MKLSSSLLFLATLSPLALGFAGCSAQDVVVKTPAKDAKTADTWETLQTYPFEQREAFIVGLDRMVTERETEVVAMNAKLKGLPDDAAQKRDRNMKEFSDAQAAMAAQIVVLRASTAETWPALRATAVDAWARLQLAYETLATEAAS